MSASITGMRSARIGRAPMLVHASFAFVHAVERGARLEEPLRSSVDVILECEALALAGPIPACVVRLGYLYGPESGDLRAYRDAFRLGRRTPLHLPLFSKPIARVIVREEHMQQTALPMPRRTPTPRVPGWRPKFPDCRKGLDQVVAAWGN